MFTWFKGLFGGQEVVKKEEQTINEPVIEEEKDKIKEEDTKFPGVVVGEIIEINKHPNADRLKMVKLDIGSQQLNIVCGGPNVEVGQLVPVAMLGANLPNGMSIKETKIRGEVSQGMICAEDELGLGTGHAEIMVLKPGAIIGGSIDAYL